MEIRDLSDLERLIDLLQRKGAVAFDGLGVKLNLVPVHQPQEAPRADAKPLSQEDMLKAIDRELGIA